MKFVSLKVENVLACNYEIEFDDRYTVIIGDNRQGKTLTARLIMLALYGTGRRIGELHESWKLKPEELLPYSDGGWIELIIEGGDGKYKIYREFGKGGKVEFYAEKDGSWEHISRKDSEIRTYLEEELGITPGLMNVVMSNEQSLIGAISYDEKLQTSVWEGWRWKTEIIRENIRKARDKCGRECANLEGEIEDLKETISSILKKWIEKGIFSEIEVERGVDEDLLEAKLELIKGGISSIVNKIGHYSEFHDKLIRLDNLDNKETIKSIIELCEEKKEFLDEKDDVEELRVECEGYLNTLTEVLKRGGRDGIRHTIEGLEDEEKKLKASKGLKEREKEPVKAECEIFPPENGEKLIVQIPDDVAKSFRYEEIASGGIAVPYDEGKLRAIEKERKELQGLLSNFEKEKSEVKEKKDSLRDEIGNKKDQLEGIKTSLTEQKHILEADKERYLDAISNKREKESLFKRLETAKEWFANLFDALSEEESLRKIRKETVAFINRIFEEVYGWDINAKLENEDKIIVTDARGNIRSHPSGSEINIMGLAWRWMVARGFDLPLVLDELDILLDEQNFERTRRLIEEEMDRQTVILTLREGLKDLPGRVYRVTRDEDISTIERLK